MVFRVAVQLLLGDNICGAILLGGRLCMAVGLKAGPKRERRTLVRTVHANTNAIDDGPGQRGGLLFSVVVCCWCEGGSDN